VFLIAIVSDLSIMSWLIKEHEWFLTTTFYLPCSIC
jgi:hypothetical protein